MTISEVSKKCNISADTLRYYEKVGLISFVDDIRNDRTPKIGLQDGLASILIATAAKKSVEEGRIVNINELYKA